MADILCSHCKNKDICKYTNEFKKQLEEFGEFKHEIFYQHFGCKRFNEAHIVTSVCDCANSAVSEIETIKRPTFIESKVVCPKCNASTMYKNVSYESNSIPSSHQYVCPNCNHMEYLEV